LSKEQWQKIINKLPGFALSPVVTLSGGEPFLRKDIIDIIGYITNAKLEPVIITNGTLFDSEMVNKLKEYPIRQITLSLNGMNPQTHEPTRGVEGCFQKTIDSIEMLAETGIPVAIETILMKPNMDEIIDLVKYTEEKKLKGIVFQVLTASNVHNIFHDDKDRVPDDQWYNSDPLWIDDIGKFRGIVEKLIEMKQNGSPIINSVEQMKYFPVYFEDQRSVSKLPCMAGVGNFMIDPYGEVRMCFSFTPIGNILEQKPLAIWRGSAAGGVRRKIKNCSATCRLLNNTW
jgi:MoaA/NifB/PqqE/SkfB family radical SAM enzyme